MPEVRLPPCPGCGQDLPSDDPMDWHLDARERGWHWSCAAQVLAAWPGQPEQVEPSGPDTATPAPPSTTPSERTDQR